MNRLQAQAGGVAAALRTRRGVDALLGAAMLASGVLLVELGSRLSFLLDDWVFIIYRRGHLLDNLFEPDNEHLVAAPVAIWKLLLATVGMGSTLPFRVVSTAMFLLGAWLMFIWIRRRIGDWPALFAAVLILFLGAAYDDLLWFSSITFLGSMACGLGMLVALDRGDRRGDRIACAWLIGSMLFSSLWLAFAAGAVVDIALRRSQRRTRERAFLVLIPSALYAAWWLGWGHNAESALSLHNLSTTPAFVLDSGASAVAALLGFAVPVEGATAPGGLDWGRPVFVLLVALAAWRMWRLKRVPRSLWLVLTVMLAFWILGGLDVKPGRTPWSSRYQYPSAALVLMFAATLLQGARLDRRLFMPALLVTGAALLGNIGLLHASYESYLATSKLERADLGAIEIARDTVEPGFVLAEEIADTGYVHVEAGPYLSARDAFGSPAYDVPELAAADEPARVAADKVLAAALRARLEPIAGAPTTGAPAPRPVSPAVASSGAGPDCIAVKTSEAAPAVVELPPGGASMKATSSAEVDLQRFSASFPVDVGTLSPGAWSSLSIPTDRASRPWQARLAGAGTVTVCGAENET